MGGGVTVKTISAGDGKHYPKKGDKLTMHYVGTLKKTGKTFDSSRDRNEPFQFSIGVGQVIRGWDEGVMKMSLGEKAILQISYDFAYGESGVPGAIPPKSDLNFEVELLAIGDRKYVKPEALSAEELEALFKPEDIDGGASKAKTTKAKGKKRN